MTILKNKRMNKCVFHKIPKVKIILLNQAVYKVKSKGTASPLISTKMTTTAKI